MCTRKGSLIFGSYFFSASTKCIFNVMLPGSNWLPGICTDTFRLNSFKMYWVHGNHKVFFWLNNFKIELRFDFIVNKNNKHWSRLDEKYTMLVPIESIVNFYIEFKIRIAVRFGLYYNAFILSNSQIVLHDHFHIIPTLYYLKLRKYRS